jgi:uncharacterized protein YndB with AHSA1/START domain
MTADETTLELRREFDASPAAVFDAWLTREEWAAWIGPEGMQCEVPTLEPRVGGRYEITMRLGNGQVIPVSGVFQVIERPKRLVFSWGWNGDPATAESGHTGIHGARRTHRIAPAPGRVGNGCQSRRSWQGLDQHAQQA